MAIVHKAGLFSTGPAAVLGARYAAPQPCALSPVPSALRPRPCALDPVPSALRPRPTSALAVLIAGDRAGSLATRGMLLR